MSSSDSHRPPVLAHQRFLADKESLADLNLAQRFRRIHDTNMWGAAASASGLGSEIDATIVLRTELPRLFKKLGMTSLLDAPCGDAGWINKADLGVRIVGVDIVPALIASLQARAAAGVIKGEYHLADITRDPLPRCDAVLCRDALVHLSFENIERAVANFKASGAVWLIRLVLACVVGLDAARGRRQGCRQRVAGSDFCRLRFDLAAVADAQSGGRSGGRTAGEIRRGSRPGAGECSVVGMDAIPRDPRRYQAGEGARQHSQSRPAPGSSRSHARPRRLPHWPSRVFRSRSNACALREGAQPASQARRTACAQNPRSQTVFRYRAALGRCHLRHELAGRL